MNLTSHLPRVMAALALVVGMTQCGGPAAPAEEAASAPTARLTRVGVRTMEWAPFAHSFAVQGNVETDRVANILAEFPGVVDAVLVEEGTQVAKGEAILRINTDVLQKQRAELTTQLQLAQTLFERQERLWNKDIGSEVEYLQARAGVEALERSLATLDEQVDKATIRAPFPMAWVPAAHAVTVFSHGPCHPYRIETAAAGALGIIIGTRNGETRLAPRASRTSIWSSSVPMPPMPVPIDVARRAGSAVSSPAISIAWAAAASAYWEHGSLRRASLGLSK